MSMFIDSVAALREFAERNRASMTVAFGAFALVSLAAVVIPVGLPDSGATVGRDPALDGATAAALQDEDLSDLLASKRWGVVLQDILDEAAAAAAAEARAAQEMEMTRELAEIGFVGLMVEPREYAVLLVLPDGKISRLAGGDTLPDGRTLAAITGNSLTLETEEGEQDVLPLFPRLITE